MTTLSPDTDVVDFLVRSAREFRRGGWVFTGFHWPVLAGQLAYQLTGQPFTQAFEAGASAHEAAQTVPTSTTDYPSYDNARGFSGDSASILLAMSRKFDRVILDGSNVDLLGRANSSLIGPRDKPQVRLPGGGGAADVAAQARELIWLFGADDVNRLQPQVEHVTAAPGAHTLTRLHCRWGTMRLGLHPTLEEWADVRGLDRFRLHLEALGVDTADAQERHPITPLERAAALTVLRQAAERGYHVARRALQQSKG